MIHRMLTLLTSSVFMFFICFTTAKAENWTGFRGPGRQGHSTETMLPIEWSEKSNTKWKIEVVGEGWSSPIVWDDRVFLSTVTEGGTSCRMLAFERQTGKLLWNTEVFQQKPGHKQGKNSYATSTPVTDGEKIYALFGDGSFAAVDVSGKLVWINREYKFYGEHGLGASPLLHGNLLIMPFDGSSSGPDPKVGWQMPWDEAVILGLDKQSGKEVWKGSRGMSRIGHVSPVIVEVDGGEELISCAGDAIQGFNPTTGERLWHVFSLGEGVVPSPAFGDGLIFTASGFGDSTLRTVRPGGLGDVTKSHVAWEQRKGTPSQSSLLYVKPFLYGISEGGTATCYRAESGEVVWQKRLDGSYCSSPVYAEGHIYFLSEQGQTTVLASGERFEVLAKNPLNEKCQASMAVSNQSLFIRTEKHLWCVGK